MSLDKFKDLWRCICICHEITQINKLEDDKIEKNSVIRFTGPSQDELTLLDMSNQVGFSKFIEKNHDFIKI
jgi:hypothetical protein